MTPEKPRYGPCACDDGSAEEDRGAVPRCPVHGHDLGDDLDRINEAAKRIPPGVDVLAEITKEPRR